MQAKRVAIAKEFAKLRSIGPHPPMVSTLGTLSEPGKVCLPSLPGGVRRDGSVPKSRVCLSCFVLQRTMEQWISACPRVTPPQTLAKTLSSALSLLVKDGEMSPDGPDSSGQLVPPPTPDKRTPRARPAPAAQSKEEAEAAPAEWTMLEEAAAEWAVEEEEEQEEGVAEGEEEELEGEVETLEGEVEGLEGDEEELKGEEAPQSVQAWSCGVVPWRSTFQLQPPDENNNKRTCRCAKILSRLAALEGEVAMAKKAAAEAMAAAMACRAGAASAAVASVATVVEDSPAESGGQHHTPGRKSLQTTPKSAQKGEHLRKLPKKGTLYGRWCVCLFVCLF